MNNKTYRGRFAPSPSGNLHFGSLVAALASFCQARSQHGEWLLRIEDLDPPRAIPGADKAIIAELTRFGMVSDQPVLYQSDEKQQQDYFTTLQQLIINKQCYPCTCNRKTLSQHTIYQKTCQHQAFPIDLPHAIKITAPDQEIKFHDAIQGIQQQNIQKQCGDFNIRRKDGLICYQMAVVVDDAKQGITEVVRGMDILDSTARQIHLQQQLGLSKPKYAHFPVITHADGNKLSKQNHAKEIYGEDAYELTFLALKALGQNPIKTKVKNQAELLKRSISDWNINGIPKNNIVLGSI